MGMNAPGTIILTFSQTGQFAANVAAEKWLREHGFSYGPLQNADPRGVLFGAQRVIAKWRCIPEALRGQLHGAITGDPCTGPIVVTIYANAPAAARLAVNRAA